MKILISLAAVVCLSGCVAVPYDAPPATYYETYPAYGYAYPVAPVYAAPAPVYVRPPVHFSFGLNYRSGRGHGHHHHHLDGFRGRGHGFHRGPGFRGGFHGR